MRIPLVSRLKWPFPSLAMLDAIIVMTMCWTIFQFVYPSWRIPRAPRPTAAPIALNRTATVPGVDWSATSTTVAVAFTLSCKFSQASGSFYRTLAENLKAHLDKRLLVISPDPAPELAQWMHANGVDAFEHVNVNFALHGFRITPTLALIDHTGRVTDVVVGKLSPTEEGQVIARLNGTTTTPLSIRAENLQTGGAR